MILMADHEITNSASVLLNTASALADPYSCCAAATLSGIGILHGGAIEVAYKQLEAVRDISEVPALLEDVKSGKKRLYGYGHRKWKVRLPYSPNVVRPISPISPSGYKRDGKVYFHPGKGGLMRENESDGLKPTYLSRVDKADKSSTNHLPAPRSPISIVSRADRRRHAKHRISEDRPPSRRRT